MQTTDSRSVGLRFLVKNRCPPTLVAAATLRTAPETAVYVLPSLPKQSSTTPPSRTSRLRPRVAPPPSENVSDNKFPQKLPVDKLPIPRGPRG